MNMQGVFMLVNEFPPLATGGAERQAERLAAYLAWHACPVTVITRGAQGLPSTETRRGFHILRIPAWGLGKMKTFTFVLGALWAIFRNRRQYEILHAHLAFGPALAGALMGKLLGKGVLVKFGTSGPFGDIQTSQRTLRGRFRLAVLRKWADGVIVLDPEMEAEVLNAGFSSLRVYRISNGIDAKAFKPCQKKPAAKAALGLANKKVLLFVGRLSAQKSLATLIRALKLALEKDPDLHLLMVGDGEERQSLIALANDLGVASHITFTGHKPDARRYLDAADIFVLPSLSEGISNALLEAMSAGLACIATAVGGTPDLLEHGACGILVEPSQPELLAQAILDLAGDPGRIFELGKLARTKILDDYDFSVIGKSYLDLYHLILKHSWRAA